MKGIWKKKTVSQNSNVRIVFQEEMRGALNGWFLRLSIPYFGFNVYIFITQEYILRPFPQIALCSSGGVRACDPQKIEVKVNFVIIS